MVLHYAQTIYHWIIKIIRYDVMRLINSMVKKIFVYDARSSYLCILDKIIYENKYLYITFSYEADSNFNTPFTYILSSELYIQLCLNR